MRAKSLQSHPCDPMDRSPQAPLSMGFSRQQYWGGLLLPSPRGIFPTKGSNPGLISHISCTGKWVLFTTSTTWEALKHYGSG